MLHAENITYHYGAHAVLNGATVRLDPGQVGLLIGHNGAGKSTLLRCLANWTRADAGTIIASDVDAHQQERAYRRQVVFVPDVPDFYDALTAWEHLQFVGQLYRIDGWQPRAESLLTAFGLGQHGDAYPFTFSRGMRVKLATVTALLVNPPLLLLDEPFGPLDPHAAAHLWRELHTHAEANNAVLFSSHALPSEAAPDVVFRLGDGRIEAFAAPPTTDLAELLDYVD